MPETANDDDDDSPRGDLFSQRSMQVASYCRSWRSIEGLRLYTISSMKKGKLP